MIHSIRDIKGVGEKTEKLFSKLGIYSVEDILRYFPRDYDIYEKAVPVKEVIPGRKMACQVQLLQTPSFKSGASHKIITVKAGDEGGYLQLLWFNMPFLRSVLKKGAIYVVRGKIHKRKDGFYMEHPEYFTPAAYDKITDHMQPVYGLTAGLTNKTVTKVVSQALQSYPALLQEWMPKEILVRFKLETYETAMQAVHFPRKKEDFIQARQRLAFDEFLLFIMTIRSLKEKQDRLETGFRQKLVWKTEEMIDRLPYRLTKAQIRVWREIEEDLTGSSPMARLVQGDVGSGKTVIAFLAMAMTVENGAQAALMVPTEVLANQHFESLKEFLTEEEWERYQPLLLTGSVTGKEKKQRQEMAANGEARIIIGTHAVIQANVDYKELGLVITDEQHRFGVKQRDVFKGKGLYPHMLVMSATPIPRTLAVILYGDLQISVIDELPANRLPIKNCVVGADYRARAYQFIAKEVEEGHQAYIICPMVEESEDSDGENVVDYTQSLQNLWGDGIPTEYLHGKMRPVEKQEIMDRFLAGEIKVLVSTTVVEVGVNLPNATVMMVENAERFGLAQLHQLRGRVGRGPAQSYCIFIRTSEDEKAVKRLDILNHSNDGFYVAGEDMKMRGPGDLLGIRQSGDLNFKIADIYRDADLLAKASEAAGYIIGENLLEKEDYRSLLSYWKSYYAYMNEGISL